MSKFKLYEEYSTPQGDTGIIVDISYEKVVKQDVYTIEFSEREKDIVKCLESDLDKYLIMK